MTLVAPLDFGSKCCYSMQTVNLGGYMLSVKDKVDWLREYAPSSIRCDAEGVWLDYQHNRITQRQAVIRLNKWIKAAHRERTYLAMGLITGQYSN